MINIRTIRHAPAGAAVSRRPAGAQTLDRLILDLETACSRRVSNPVRIASVEAVLAKAVRRGGWLPPRYAVPDPRAYRVQVIHADAQARFSLCAMAWLPGQSTPIHDHIAWCVVGVYSGSELNTSYHLRSDAQGEYLVAGASSVLERGATAGLLPPSWDIHRVSCIGPGPSVSLHVYGTDIRTAGSSISRVFDDLPIRSGSRTER